MNFQGWQLACHPRASNLKRILRISYTQYASARPYLQIVPRRNAQTLLPIIGRKVAPGSVLHTDCWAAYNRARRALRLQHFTINHSKNFVDPVTRVHTQNAESDWNVAKWKFKKMRGNTNPQFLQEYLQECGGDGTEVPISGIILDVF